jgi:hypothetical protein
MSECDRYSLARAYYCYYLCEQQDLPEEQRERSNIDEAIRIVLALFPELVLDHGIAKPALEFFEFEEGEQPTHTPADDNIIYLR